jgi:CRISPR-associated protein Cmr2
VSFDLYVDMQGPAPDPPTRLRLLAGRDGEAAVLEYKQLVHPKAAPYAGYIKAQCGCLLTLGLLKPSPPIEGLPTGSWFLQFEFTLAKPWLSKDDDPFYVTDAVNPVRKDKVFKVPMMAASSWKGLLRWAVMQAHLVERKDELTPDEFAERRLAHTLLFGDEKGEEPGSVKDFSRSLDDLKPHAKDLYRQQARQHFNVAEEEALPHHSGRLICYPTFFDLIDVEVINPHSRTTRAGINPIYLECVPAGAKGTFSLLYVPVDLIGQPSERIRQQATMDLREVCPPITALMLTYGFSAKRTSGFGSAEGNVTDGAIRSAVGSWKVSKLSVLDKESRGVRF